MLRLNKTGFYSKKVIFILRYKNDFHIVTIQGYKMIFSTTPDVPGREITENLGVVAGNIVQSKHVGRDLMAGLKGIVGGEISGYTEMLADARDKAIERMVSEAQKRDADAIVNIRFTTSAIMANASEMLAYGTAVKLK